MIYVTIKGFIRVIIQGSPRLLILNSLIWILFGTSCGVIGLSINGFSNILTLFFLGWAAMEIVVALSRFALWRKQGLRRSLPDGTTFLRMDHILQVQERTRLLLNVRETITRYHKQLVILAPPASDSQRIPVCCATCQQEMIFRVDSLGKRRAIRLRAVAIAALCLLAGLGLGIFSSAMFQPQPPADWANWVGLLSLVLLFCSLLATAYAVNYVGAVVVKAPIGHKVRQPEKADYEQFRQMVGSARSEPAMQQFLPSQQGWR